MSNLALTDDLQVELDNLMQEGYTESMKNNSIAASEIWIKLWGRIKEIMKTYEIPNIETMDEVFHGQQSIYNWSTDFETELYNASIDDRTYSHVQIDFCREYIAMSKEKDEHNNLGRRRAIAESYFKLGDVEKGERLFKKYVHQYPEDAWGWINWSDQYGLPSSRKNFQDYEKAMSILETGLNISGLIDKEDVLERLTDLYTNMGMDQKAADAEREIEVIKNEKQKKNLENIQALNEMIEQSSKSMPVKRQKTGRNDPCPCGSGKKYKKCCGR
ncbi:SEC-C metal-binding domain-containing protein [Virgibacillus sp. W0181]|uniref:SEC-C metal-binding domain-containing protein n=1 Tax=Virgibacillus sp. W0181 TaxID=3391581 RepID=UPI003F482135